MVPGTKLWKLIHRRDKIKPIYLTIYLLCACLCGPTDLLVCRCRSFHTREGCVCAFVAANWSRALKSPERTEFFGQPVNCAVNTSVCLSFARFRYFRVSSSLLLWVSGPVVRFWHTLTHWEKAAGLSLWDTGLRLQPRATWKRNFYRNKQNKKEHVN